MPGTLLYLQVLVPHNCISCYYKYQQKTYCTIQVPDLTYLAISRAQKHFKFYSARHTVPTISFGYPVFFGQYPIHVNRAISVRYLQYVESTKTFVPVLGLLLQYYNCRISDIILELEYQ
jgi:hypothetical protein